MRLRSLPVLLLLLTAAPVFADNVYLANGRKFEDVMAETTGTQVRIHLQGGVLVLPKSQVLRVEAGDSNLGQYLRQKEILKKSPATRAADWVELARWAQSKQLDQATREAALAAAILDPHVPGLAPILRGFGYVLDEQLDRWVRYEDAMRRKGFMQSNGQWITAEEYQWRARAQADEDARRRADRQEQARSAREERLEVLTELALTRELVQPQAQPPYLGPYAPWGTSVVLLPGFVTSPGRHDGRTPDLFHLEPDFGATDFVHVPGSLIPGRLPGSGSHRRH
ncbi:MAG TPA: hypothetical protein VGS07_06230 [Thermoanaerobaculia bacterium]|jgi:hypothetical protein|nr:hypothetical protein [Thermoanaerobaculia bacterium]